MNWVEIEQEISKWKCAPDFTNKSLSEYQKKRSLVSSAFKDLDKYYAEQKRIESHVKNTNDPLKTAASLCRVQSLIIHPEICRLVISCLVSKYNCEERSTSADADLNLSSNSWCMDKIRDLLKPHNSSIAESLPIAQDCELSSFEIDELFVCESINTLISFIDDTLKIFPQFPSELLSVLCIDCIRLCTSSHSVRLVEKVLNLCIGIPRSDVKETDSPSIVPDEDLMEALIHEIVIVNQFVYDGLDLSTRKSLCLFSSLVLEHEIMSVLDAILFGRYLNPCDKRDIIKNSLIYKVILDNPGMGTKAFEFLVKLVQETSDWRVVRAFVGWNQCLFEDSLTDQLPRYYPEYLAQLVGILCRPPRDPRCYEHFLNLRDQILSIEMPESPISQAHCVWLLSLTPLCWREKPYSWIMNIEQYPSLCMLEGPLTFCSWLGHPSDQPMDDLKNLTTHNFAEFIRSHLPLDKFSIDGLVVNLERSLNTNGRNFVTIEQILKIASDTNRLDIMTKLFDTYGIHPKRKAICDMSTCSIILDFWYEARSDLTVHTEHPIMTELIEVYNSVLC
ncbi:hypothetical protein K7432_011967 [Basidiobolus ranarum]|uniref:Uncharacterized protein n=1 Tax=Basidiobolus ranarum TaxID=34480 RepID=A0ABR2VT58_9FUNG